MTATTPKPPSEIGSLPSEAAILPLADQENFSVASLLLGRKTRDHLLAIYGFARLADQLGDEASGDRLALLDHLEEELGRAFDADGEPEHPVLQRLVPTVRAFDLPREPFLRLIEANRQDQEKTTYATYAELARYCELSANPVGELVLHVFGVATPERIALSDSVCTGLQLVEHWQDVAEDARRGRVYVPAEDLARFGVAREQLSASTVSEPLRALLAFEVARARDLLDEGAPLVGTLKRTRALRGRRLRRRRPRERRRHRRHRVRRARRAAEGEQLEPPARDALDVEDGAMSTATALPAYEHCRQVARRAGSSFYAGMRLLPPDRRSALYAVYALARRIDDIADGGLPTPDRLELLERVRGELRTIDESSDPVLVAVADAARRYPIPLAAFEELIDGAELDVRGTDYATFAELERYCRCVAGSIGRLALGVFECSDREAAGPLADDLGVALQLGNILRDLSEDVPNGRVYLPLEDLERFGCSAVDGRLDGPVELVVAFEAQRGLERLERGLGLVSLIDRRSAACVLAMTGAYRRLLERIAAQPETVLHRRLSLRRWEKGLVLARSLIGGVTA